MLRELLATKGGQEFTWYVRTDNRNRGRLDSKGIVYGSSMSLLDAANNQFLSPLYKTSPGMYFPKN